MSPAFLSNRDSLRPLIRKLDALMDLEPAEIEYLAGVHDDRRAWDRGDVMIEAGEAYGEVVIVDAGWAIAYKLLADGRRQVLRIILPGDIIGLHFSVASTAQISVEALTPIAAALFPAEHVLGIYRNQPRIGAAMAWTAAREEAILSEHLVSVGRRTALERLAHLFLELLRRLQLIDMAGERTMALPVTQAVLADAMGLSIVHISRTLREMRRAGFVRLNDHRLVIEDLAGLQKVADFDDEFLMNGQLPEKWQSQSRY